MNRRDFLKSAVITGAALTVPIGLDPVLSSSRRRGKNGPGRCPRDAAGENHTRRH